MSWALTARSPARRNSRRTRPGVRSAGPLPGAAQAGGEGAGQAELGISSDDQPGPGIGLGWAAQAGPREPEGLLPEPESVLDVESSQVRTPKPVQVARCGAQGTEL